MKRLSREPTTEGEYTSSSSITRKVSGCDYSLMQKKDAPAVHVKSQDL